MHYLLATIAILEQDWIKKGKGKQSFRSLRACKRNIFYGINEAAASQKLALFFYSSDHTNFKQSKIIYTELDSKSISYF